MNEQEERYGDAAAVFDCLKYHASAGGEYEYRGAMALEAFDRICTALLDLKAQRDGLLAERDKLLFHESQLVESLKSYMNKYGPGYSCTDTLAYDNATGVLAAIANVEKHGA